MRSSLLLVLLLAGLAPAAWADIYCPSCGVRYPDSYHYCPKDGTNLDEARKAAQGTATWPKDRAASSAEPEPDAEKPAAKEPAAKAPAAKEPAAKAPVVDAQAKDWAEALPIHLPEAYPDANLGDYALLEWTPKDPAQTTIFSRIVLRKGEKGRIDVLLTAIPWPKKSAEAPPPSLNDVLSKIGPDNSRRETWADYRDFAGSFQVGGKPLLSPFVGGDKPERVSRKNHPIPIPKTTVGADVVEYRTKRDGKLYKHVIKTSEQVPYAFVESTWEGLSERLQLYLFGTLDEDDMAPLERMFPAR
jgi:hypothetical protein